MPFHKRSRSFKRSRKGFAKRSRAMTRKRVTFKKRSFKKRSRKGSMSIKSKTLSVRRWPNEIRPGDEAIRKMVVTYQGAPFTLGWYRGGTPPLRLGNDFQFYAMNTMGAPGRFNVVGAHGTTIPAASGYSEMIGLYNQYCVVGCKIDVTIEALLDDNATAIHWCLIPLSQSQLSGPGGATALANFTSSYLPMNIDQWRLQPYFQEKVMEAGWNLSGPKPKLHFSLYMPVHKIQGLTKSNLTIRSGIFWTLANPVPATETLPLVQPAFVVFNMLPGIPSGAAYDAQYSVQIRLTYYSKWSDRSQATAA